MKLTKKIFGFTAITVFSLQAFAADTISITVKTNEKTAAGIGYSVEGKKLGGPGKVYSGKGPVHKRYLFGYRKNSVHGANVPCGALTLNKNTNVVLVTKGNKCQTVVSQ